MIDKTPSGFNLCCHKHSLTSTLILHRPGFLNRGHGAVLQGPWAEAFSK